MKLQLNMMQVNCRHGCTAMVNYTCEGCSLQRGKRIRHVLARALSWFAARDTRPLASSQALGPIAWSYSAQASLRKTENGVKPTRNHHREQRETPSS